MEHARRLEIHRLMVRLADGDRGAFGPLYDALWPVLLGFTGRLLPSRQDAEDAAQSTLMKVLSRASEHDPARDALSWVLGIAAFECRTLRKQAHRRREQHDESGALGARAAETPSPEDMAVARELEAAAREVLGALRPEDAETLRLVAEGRHPEGVTGPTFRKRVERALSRLRAAWSARNGTETF